MSFIYLKINPYEGIIALLKTKSIILISCYPFPLDDAISNVSIFKN